MQLHAIAAAVKAAKKAAQGETEKGVALAPAAKDFKLWYSSSNSYDTEEVEDERRFAPIHILYSVPTDSLKQKTR